MFSDFLRLPVSGGVYCLTLQDGRRYVGQSNNIRKRVRQHFSTATTRTRCPGLVAAMKECDVSDVYILAHLETVDERDACERHFIARWHLTNPLRGCNHTSGGGVSEWSAAARETLAAAARRRWAGTSSEKRKWTIEQRLVASVECKRAIAEGIRKPPTMWGRKHSSETLEKMRAAAALRWERERVGWVKPEYFDRTGRPHSEETKKKISSAGIGRRHTLESRRKMSEAIMERWASHGMDTN